MNAEIKCFQDWFKQANYDCDNREKELMLDAWDACVNSYPFVQEDKWISVEVKNELDRAKEIHPGYPNDMFRQIAIMNEEAEEATKAVLHYHYEKGSIDDVKKELIQTMAMCMRMLENLPKPPITNKPKKRGGCNQLGGK